MEVDTKKKSGEVRSRIDSANKELSGRIIKANRDYAHQLLSVLSDLVDNAQTEGDLVGIREAIRGAIDVCASVTQSSGLTLEPEVPQSVERTQHIEGRPEPLPISEDEFLSCVATRTGHFSRGTTSKEIIRCFYRREQAYRQGTAESQILTFSDLNMRLDALISEDNASKPSSRGTRRNIVDELVSAGVLTKTSRACYKLNPNPFIDGLE